MWLRLHKQYTIFFSTSKKSSSTAIPLNRALISRVFPLYDATSYANVTMQPLHICLFCSTKSQLQLLDPWLPIRSFFPMIFHGVLRDSWVRITNAWNWIKLPGNYRVNKRMPLHKPPYYGRHFFGSWDTRIYISTLYSVCLWFIFIGCKSESGDYSYCSCLQVFSLIFIVVNCLVLGCGQKNWMRVEDLTGKFIELFKVSK